MTVTLDEIKKEHSFAGLTLTANNFIIKATNVDYGELIAVR